VERLAARIAVAARREGVLDLRTRAARVARYVMPLAAAAGIAAVLLLRTTEADRDVSPDAAIAQAFSRSDAGDYLVDVAFAGYDEAWARQFTGGDR
jgi:ABC-type ATPase with predicted acetyltransferase domain